MRWSNEQLFRTRKTKGFDVEALRQETDGPLEKLVTAILSAAVSVIQLVHEREGKALRPLGDVFALERVCRSLEAKPHCRKTRILPNRSPIPLGSWHGSAAGPATTENLAPIVVLRGLTRFHAIKLGWTLRHVRIWYGQARGGGLAPLRSVSKDHQGWPAATSTSAKPLGSATCRACFFEPGGCTAKTHFLELNSNAAISVPS
ncbi:MAG: hypothetical protein ACREDV_09140 [Methylocella sp.]